ncbi:hypothetical protein ACHAQH_003320 [Verticillium albo-atrum]
MRHTTLSTIGLLAATATALQAISPNPLRDLVKRQDEDDTAEEAETARESLRDRNRECLSAMETALGTGRPPVPSAVASWIEANPYTPTEEDYENGGPQCTMEFPASLSDDVTSFYSSHMSWWSTRSYELGGEFTFTCQNTTMTAELQGESEDDSCSNRGFLFTGEGITTFDPLDSVPFTTPADASVTPSSGVPTSVLPSGEATETGAEVPQVTDVNGAGTVTGVLAAVVAAAGVAGVLAL